LSENNLKIKIKEADTLRTEAIDVATLTRAFFPVLNRTISTIGCTKKRAATNATAGIG
jgi:hypothetical protein